MNIQEITSKVEQVLEQSQESLYAHMIAERAGATKDQAIAALKRLAAQGVVECTPTQGRWGNRYALIRSAKPVAVDRANKGVAQMDEKPAKTRMDAGNEGVAQSDAPFASTPVEVAAHMATVGQGETRMDTGVDLKNVDHFGQELATEVAAPSSEDIDAVFNAMPDGVDGWLKTWGYRQFAREILNRFGSAQPAGQAQDSRSSEKAQEVQRPEGYEWDQGENPPNRMLYALMGAHNLNYLSGAELCAVMDYGRDLWRTAMEAATPTSEPGTAQKELLAVYTEDMIPAKAMLELITSTGGDGAFRDMEDESQQAYLNVIFNHVHSAACALWSVGKGR